MTLPELVGTLESEKGIEEIKEVCAKYAKEKLGDKFSQRGFISCFNAALKIVPDREEGTPEEDRKRNAELIGSRVNRWVENKLAELSASQAEDKKGDIIIQNPVDPESGSLPAVDDSSSTTSENITSSTLTLGKEPVRVSVKIDNESQEAEPWVMRYDFAGALLEDKVKDYYKLNRLSFFLDEKGVRVGNHPDNRQFKESAIAFAKSLGLEREQVPAEEKEFRKEILKDEETIEAMLKLLTMLRNKAKHDGEKNFLQSEIREFRRARDKFHPDSTLEAFESFKLKSPKAEKESQSGANPELNASVAAQAVAEAGAKVSDPAVTEDLQDASSSEAGDDQVDLDIEVDTTDASASIVETSVVQESEPDATESGDGFNRLRALLERQSSGDTKATGELQRLINAVHDLEKAKQRIAELESAGQEAERRFSEVRTRLDEVNVLVQEHHKVVVELKSQLANSESARKTVETDLSRARIQITSLEGQVESVTQALENLDEIARVKVELTKQRVNLRSYDDFVDGTVVSSDAGQPASAKNKQFDTSSKSWSEMTIEERRTVMGI